MFDKVKLWLDTYETSGFEKILTGYNEQPNKETGELRQWGTLKNMKVRAGERGVTLEGSLPKYLYGDNLSVMSRKSTQEAIEDISDALHLSMEQARVCRFEVAQNFVMKKPVLEYTSLLVSAPFYKRSDIADRQTVNFHNKERIKSIYDKVQELKKSRQDIGDLQNKNILRYEVRFNKRLGKQFGRNQIIVKDLFDDILYSKIIHRWESEYFSIVKLKRERSFSVQSKKDLEESLIFIGLQNLGGVDAVIDSIMAAHKDGKINSKMSQRLRGFIKKIACISGKKLPSDDCVAELDSKIKQAAMYCR